MAAATPCDPLGRLLGWWRLVTGRGIGEPRFSEVGRRTSEEAKLYRYNKPRMDQLIAETAGHPEALRQLGEFQKDDRAWEALLVTARELRTKFPGVASGYRLEACALMNLNEVAAAERLARRAMNRFPRNAAIAFIHAQCAEARGDVALALHRWRACFKSFPGDLWANLLYARAAGEQGQVECAERVFAAAVARWPNEWSCWAWWAELAEKRLDWDVAANRWLAVVEHFSARSNGYIRAIKALEQAGRRAEAAELRDSAAYLFRNEAAFRSAAA